MSISLVDKCKPTKLSDLSISPTNKKTIKNWVYGFKKDPINCKKVLLITGPTGVGKSTMARLIFKHYKLRFIEYDSVDLKLKKSIKTQFTNLFQYDNVVNMFNKGKSPSGVLIDEIEILLNNKIEKNNVMKNLLKLLKLDSKGEFNMKYPIICTYVPFSNKNIKLLKTFSDIIKIRAPSKHYLNSIIEKLSIEHNFKIEMDASLMLANYADGDISRLIKLLELLLVNNKKIVLEDIQQIMKVFMEKNCTYQLFDVVKYFVNNKIEDDKLTNFYLQDTMLMPLLFYDNIGKCILKKKYKEDDSKYDTMIDCIECCANHDILQNYIIKKQNFNLTLANAYNMIELNILINNNKNNGFISDINFAKILHKTSLFYSKRKKKSSLYQADCDLIDEIKNVYIKNKKKKKKK